MQNRYENLTRGTKELPFARYDFTIKQKNFIITQTHFHNEFEIISVKSGELNLLVEGESYILKSGDIAFINPNEYHAVKSAENTVSYTAFVFSKDIITFPAHHFFQNKFTSPVFSGQMKLPTLFTHQNTLYEKLINPIKKLRDKHTAQDPDILYLLLEIFTVFINEDALIKFRNTTTKIPDYIKICIDYIADNCEKNINLAQLSDIVHLSPNYLCTSFKTATGLSPIEHLQVIRIKKATQLLLQTDFSIEEISLKCGFQNVGYFIKIFKNQNAVTPHAFRKKMTL